MDNIEKFTNKVDNYVKYRPGYPQEFIDYLSNELGFSNSSVSADIGAGTGILTRSVAKIVKTLYAVEPNNKMRSACEKGCKNYKNVISINGSAEETTLQDNSIDFITVAQAFHWFDKLNCLKEFKRILKPENKVVLVWNRKAADDPFVRKSSELYKKYCPDYKGIAGNSDLSPEHYNDFFKNKTCDYRIFDNDLLLSLDNYIGGVLSASYALQESDPNYKEFTDKLMELFHKYSKQEKLLLNNKTHSYAGQV